MDRPVEDFQIYSRMTLYRVPGQKIRKLLCNISYATLNCENNYHLQDLTTIAGKGAIDSLKMCAQIANAQLIMENVDITL